jgi:hypothetical protein
MVDITDNSDFNNNYDGWVVNNVTPSIVSNKLRVLPDGYVDWSNYISQSMYKTVDIQGDFDITTSLSYGPLTSSPIGLLYLALEDDNGDATVYAGYRDAWSNNSGYYRAVINAAEYSSGDQGDEPSSATITINIKRVNNTITIKINDAVVLNTINDSIFTKVHLTNVKFSSYGYNYADWDYVNMTYYSEEDPEDPDEPIINYYSGIKKDKSGYYKINLEEVFLGSNYYGLKKDDSKISFTTKKPINTYCYWYRTIGGEWEHFNFKKTDINALVTFDGYDVTFNNLLEDCELKDIRFFSVDNLLVKDIDFIKNNPGVSLSYSRGDILFNK